MRPVLEVKVSPFLPRHCNACGNDAGVKHVKIGWRDDYDGNATVIAMCPDCRETLSQILAMSV